ncbi:MAG TPA: DUF3866 family protein [Acidimicrobiales bacterium]|nr:DUF3866 family protein [Acidimicrobiales bacterium]
MPSYRTGTVTAVLSERPGLQRVEVGDRRAYVLTELIGPVAVGDRVVLNTTAVDLGLGTGGWDVVHWNLAREAWSQPGRGGVLKLRYTSLQVDVGAAEETAGDDPAGLDGTPVVACSLHSQVACVAAAYAHAAPGSSLCYVMTDAGSLPLALSDLAAALREKGLLAGTVTVGQAFGGDREAVNLVSGMEIARRDFGANAIVVGTGPGVVGTSTGLGFSALEVATIVDLAGRGGGTPVVALRWSDADPRPRHRGISHHSMAALHFTHERAIVPVPSGASRPELGNHEVIEVEVPEMAALLAGVPLEVTTMGRGPAEDIGFFEYAGAAGVAAATLAMSHGSLGPRS